MSSNKPPLGDVVRTILATAATDVSDTKPAALRDEPDGVHQHRTAVRRLRSILAGLSPLVDEPTARRLRVMYGEWGGQLGVVRDAEVRADVAAEALEKREIADAAPWQRLVHDERTEYGSLHARLVELADALRLAEAETALDDFVADPGIPPGDERRTARKPLRRILEHEVRRVGSVARRLDDSIASQHRLRKAARRLRYIAEAVAAASPDILSETAVPLAEAGEAVHDLLGDHRDLLIFADRLERERVRAARAGEPVAIYDDLLEDTRAAAARRLAGLGDALADIVRAGRALE